MSLIGDALKKAHLEAVRQDGRRLHLAHTPGVAHYRSTAPSPSRPWLALFCLNVALAIAVAALAFWAWQQRQDAPAPVPAVQSTTPPFTQASVQPSSVKAEPVPVAEPAAARVSNDAPAPKRSVEPAPPPAIVESVTTTMPVEEHTVAHGQVEISPAFSEPATRSGRTRGGLVDGQTYMRTLPVPGGTELVLNGMSIAGGRGVALINGRMLREGDQVGPFRIERIANRRIELSYEDITVYLRLP